MGLFSRVLASLTRNFGKTILLLLIIFILGCIISGAISVQHAVSNTDANIRDAFPPIVTVEMDHRALDEHINAIGGEWPEDLEHFGHETLVEIAALPQVKNYDFSVGYALQSSELEIYIPEGNNEIPFAMGEYNSFALTGMQHDNPLDISEGVIEITQGRMFTATELDNFTAVAIVSENFARVNNLGVGSSLELEDLFWDMREVRDTGWDDSFYIEENIYDRRAYSLEIVGIFTPLVESNTGEPWADDWMNLERENRIYVPNTFATEAQIWHAEQELAMFPDDEWLGDMEPEDFIWYQNVFRLYDSADIPDFRTAVEAITPDFYTVVDAGSDASAGVEASMQSLSNLANIIFWIAVVASVLILSLLITLFLRDRKREIGIYLAIGEGRAKVIVQVMFEVLIIALIAIVLSLFAGNILSASISESMLRNNLAAAQSDEGMSFGGPLDRMGISADVSTDQVLANYSVSLDAATIAIFFAVTIGVVVIATIVPMLYILRLNPRKIMM